MVAITDYTFPSLDIEERILSVENAEIRAGNNKQVDAVKQLTSEADAVITQFAPINAR